MMKLLPSQILMMERIARERDCILTHADSANASLCSGLGLIGYPDFPVGLEL
jgi:hypothetical protein